MRRRRQDAAPAAAEAVDPPTLLGRPAESPVRYIVRYAKQGPARFLGHNDLVNGLQRVFRRAGVETAFSEGFHPKPVMSFGPALPLGMAGCDEFLEFKSGRDIDEAEFLAAVRTAAPPGLSFHALGRRGPTERPLQERLRGMVYTVDLGDPAFAEAPIAGSEAAARVTAVASADPAFAWLESVEASADGALLRLRAAIRAQKIPRPQDLIGKALGLERPSFVLTREAFLTAEPASPADLPV
jgi:radical SAM-linked protein